MVLPNIGLLRISESIRAYAYLVSSLQASPRSRLTGNTASALTAQRAFLNNFENAISRRVDIREDIKHHQQTLSYTSSKVEYNIEEAIYMLPSSMNINIKSGTVGYNNKILVSDGMFTLGENSKVNTLELTKEGDKPKISHKVVVQPTITHKASAHEEERLLWYHFQYHWYPKSYSLFRLQNCYKK